MPTSVAQLLAASKASLATVSELQPSAHIDSYWLLAFVLNKSQSWLRAWPDAEVADSDLQQFEQLLARRKNGEPVAYLLGQQGFYDLDLQVTPDTLIPRPDTELLVDLGLAAFSPTAPCKVLDLGTGSGAIALAIKQQCPLWQVMATDIHPPTLEVATNNAQRLGLAVEFRLSDWFAAIAADEKFNLIVSNPPYIPEHDPHLQGPGVRFEPWRALVSGPKGLDAITQLIAQAPKFLQQAGLLMIEHGYDQAAVVRELLVEKGFEGVASHQDLSGIERVTGGCWQPSKTSR